MIKDERRRFKQLIKEHPDLEASVKPKIQAMCKELGHVKGRKKGVCKYCNGELPNLKDYVHSLERTTLVDREHRILQKLQEILRYQ